MHFSAYSHKYPSSACQKKICFYIAKLAYYSTYSYIILNRNLERTDASLENLGKYYDQLSCLEQKIPTQVSYFILFAQPAEF